MDWHRIRRSFSPIKVTSRSWGNQWVYSSIPSFKLIASVQTVNIHPSSVLHKLMFPAIIYEELVYTNHIFARGVSAIPKSFFTNITSLNINWPFHCHLCSEPAINGKCSGNDWIWPLFYPKLRENWYCCIILTVCSNNTSHKVPWTEQLAQNDGHCNIRKTGTGVQCLTVLDGFLWMHSKHIYLGCW